MGAITGTAGSVSGVSVYVDPEVMKQNITSLESNIESLVEEVKKIDGYIQELSETRALVGPAVAGFLDTYDENRTEINKLVRGIATQDSNLINFVNNLIDHDEEARMSATGANA